MTLTRDTIFSGKKLKTKTVDLPEWGGELLVRVLSGKERSALEEWMAKNRADDGKLNNLNLMAQSIIAATIGDDGQPIFKPEDAEALKDLDAPSLVRLFEEIAELNKLTKDDVRELAKNSPAQSDGSTSV